IKVPPCHPKADVGVIYIETGGYLPMCGHDTIGFCTALIEAGLVDVTEPYTNLNLDTPAGLVKTKIKVEDGKAKEVTFANVPSFLLKSVAVDVEGIGQVSCDIAYGGNFYGIIDARELGLELTPDNASTIIEQGITIRNAINAEVDVIHPEFPFINGLTHMEFFIDTTHPEAAFIIYIFVSPYGFVR